MVVQVQPVDERAQRGLFVAAGVRSAVDPQPPVRAGGRDLGEGPYEQVVPFDAVQPAGRDDPLQIAVGGRTSRSYRLTRCSRPAATTHFRSPSAGGQPGTGTALGMASIRTPGSFIRRR